MKTRCFIILLVFFFIAAPLFAAEKPLVDSAFKKVEEAIEKEKKTSCGKIKNIYNKIQCGKKLVVAAKKEGKMRGSEEYCEKNYTQHDFKELEALLKELSKGQKTARRSLNVMEDGDRQLGELTKEDLQTEIEWVESRLARMQKSGNKKIQEGMNYKDITKNE
jgi:biopolymer transport protein ExbD